MPKSTIGPKLTVAAVLAAAGLIGACSGLETSRPMSEQTGAGGEQVGPGAQGDDAQARIDAMREAMANSDASGRPQRPSDNGDWSGTPTDSAWTPAEAERSASATPEPIRTEAPASAAGTPPMAVPAPTLDERINASATELARALRERSERDPARAAEALAALGSLALIEPGLASAYMPDVGSMSARLTPDERSFVQTWQELSRQLPPVLASGDAGRGVARLLRDGAARLDDPALSIPGAALCDRVEGYGIYRELARSGGRHKFLAGRVNKAIVYVELDGFAFRPDSQDGAPGHAIELTQDISLYAKGGVLAWRRPAQDITDFSRNRRRDFYVVQVIELPATLSVGAYELKISVRDRISGSVAERIVGLDVVADASALHDK